jgi:hypothetical protein
LPSGLIVANDPDVKSSGTTRMVFTGTPCQRSFKNNNLLQNPPTKYLLPENKTTPITLD